MKRGLFLCGVNCTPDIWDGIKSAFTDIETVFVQFPHEITQNAHSISDITKWAYAKYGRESFDFVIGHSMGGLIALELASEYGFKCNPVIFIESNLRPANAFYRNLMLPDNQIKYGEKLRKMFEAEAPFYRDDLKASLQSDFDFTPFISKISCGIFGIYGDRGVVNYSRRIGDLCLERAIEEKINFRFIRNSCHMPMIENPRELADCIRQCLDEQHKQDAAN